MNSTLPFATPEQWRALAEQDEQCLQTCLTLLRRDIILARQQGIRIPGQGEAGSAEHNQHQRNSRLIEQAGLLWLIDHDALAAEFGIQLLLGYARCYSELPFHPQKNTNPPGKLFHQLLNEHMWLLYAALGYGYLREALTERQRQTIETELFQPMLTLFTVTYAHDFDRIHNHGIWAVAAVGICGIVLRQPRYTAMAVHGVAGDDRHGGLLAQIDRLFSPSGYYLEGPYYHRFALRPLYLFAEALYQHCPQLNIYQYGGQKIRLTTEALLQMAYPNGRFPALNDASRSMDIHDEGMLVATQLYRLRYGQHPLVEFHYQQQHRRWLYPSAPMSTNTITPVVESLTLCEGECGEAGGQGILRARAPDGSVIQVVFNYGQHGMGHGHFDTLGITLFAQGREVLRDYGFARWLNVETKFGGRYLPENLSYARQTVAHNAVTVDGVSQNQADAKRADTVHGEAHGFIPHRELADGGRFSAVSARALQHYPGVAMQRTLLLLTLADGLMPLLVDLYRLSSDEPHQYDYTLQYQGQMVDIGLPCQVADSWSPLGKTAGYQHVLATASGEVQHPFSLTWLQGQHFNSWHCAAQQGELLFTRVGGDDPHMNLRCESGLLLRQRETQNALFASVFETHGFFDEASEQCHGAQDRQVQRITVLGDDEQGSVVELCIGPQRWHVMVNNQAAQGPEALHQLCAGGQTFTWQGDIAVNRAV